MRSQPPNLQLLQPPHELGNVLGSTRWPERCERHAFACRPSRRNQRRRCQSRVQPVEQDKSRAHASAIATGKYPCITVQQLLVLLATNCACWPPSHPAAPSPPPLAA
jgi:hypothetical protein